MLALRAWFGAMRLDNMTPPTAKVPRGRRHKPKHKKPTRLRPTVGIVVFALLVLATSVGIRINHNFMLREEGTTFGEPDSALNVSRTIYIMAMEANVVPATLTIREGETVKFLVTNKGDQQRVFAIGDPRVAEQPDARTRRMPRRETEEMELRPGETRGLVWRFTKPAELVYVCDIQEHVHAGMIGVLHVIRS